MDLGKKESQIAIITEAGELVEKRMRTGGSQYSASRRIRAQVT